jgi:hypothetical protein
MNSVICIIFIFGLTFGKPKGKKEKRWKKVLACLVLDEGRVNMLEEMMMCRQWCGFKMVLYINQGTSQRKIEKIFKNLWHQMNLKGTHDPGLKIKIKKIMVR